MKNFLIFLSIFVVVVLAAADAKQRMAELDRMSKCQQTKVEQVNKNLENPEDITDNRKANHN